MSTAASTPAWVRRIVRDEIAKSDQMLIDAMLANGEDVTDAALWRQRKSQLMHLLIQRAVQEKATADREQD